MSVAAEAEKAEQAMREAERWRARYGVGAPRGVQVRRRGWREVRGGGRGSAGEGGR